MSPALQGRFLTPGPPGKPGTVLQSERCIHVSGQKEERPLKRLLWWPGVSAKFQPGEKLHL